MNSKFLYFLELASRWYVFALLTVYGLGKLLGGQFYRKGNLPDEIANIPLSEVGGFDLAWSFMGYSYAYILFIGVSQLIGAGLLLFERTKLFGVFVLIPVLLNIIVFDAIFFDTYGAMASAILYFLLLVLVLVLNKERLIKIIRLIGLRQSFGAKQNWWHTVGFVFLLLLLFFGIDQFFVNVLGH
ncbi:hypothetical protein [uncultured Aquimarina sp.]|uniref:hypothetical protein n=1 Tax=uncultured Aquimarina sp. TaxID=575652 RepID=UPI00261CAB9C|nr:hypothetical protein [uncultured Aquimarina sp.]